MTDLPSSWITAEIAELVELQETGKPFQQGWSPQCERRPAEDNEWGVVKTTAIQHGEFWSHENKALPEKLDPRPKIEIKPGDVLMTCAGPRNRCGVACLVKKTRSRLMMSGKMYRFRPHPEVLDPQFLSRFIRLHETQQRIDAMKTGINDSGLNLTHARFGQLPVVVPPLNEQRRIVERIEAMFDEIDKGVESLQTARTTLGLYRQSLLKSAFEGRLTADWRAQNADRLEAPETLLARIQSERDARYKAALDAWQDALAQWRADGETGKKPAKPKRPPDIDPPTVSVTHEAWADLPLGELIGEVQQGWSPKCDDGRPIGPDDWTVVTTTAVQHHRYSDKEIKLLPARFEPRPEIEIKAGDFLMTRKGPRARTGVVCLVPATRHRIMLCDTVYRFRCDETAILPRLLEFALNSPLTMREIDELKSGISDSGISLNHGKIKSVSVKFPLSKAEQSEIVRILDEKLEAADALEAEIDAALTRAAALRQSILKKAFSGHLVPQDPNDEPASALLERIKAERAKTPQEKKKRTAHA